MKIFERFKKKKTLKSYVTDLPRLLKKRYGKHKRYTEKQVRKTVESSGLSNNFIDYAFAMYISRAEYQKMVNNRELLREYDEIRQEIAQEHFDSNIHFTIHDVFDVANTSSGFFGNNSDFSDADFDDIEE